MLAQANNEETILQVVREIGPGSGAAKMMTWEFKHAQESEMNGIYISWRSPKSKDDCFRIGSMSRCFCGCLWSKHNQQITGKKFNTSCKNCDCKMFAFIPRRPEEVGQWWLVRRKGFNINQWKPSC